MEAILKGTTISRDQILSKGGHGGGGGGGNALSKSMQAM